MTLVAARARIESLDAPAAFGRYDDSYVPQSAPMPFAAAPVRSAAYVAERRSTRRASRLAVCSSCWLSSCDC